MHFIVIVIWDHHHKLSLLSILNLHTAKPWRRHGCVLMNIPRSSSLTYIKNITIILNLRWFLATLVALHSTPVSRSVGDTEFWTTVNFFWIWPHHHWNDHWPLFDCHIYQLHCHRRFWDTEVLTDCWDFSQCGCSSWVDPERWDPMILML